MEKPSFNGLKTAFDNMKAVSPEKNKRKNEKIPSFESRVYSGIGFKASTDNRGNVIYKSSEPWRKIMILSKYSDTPIDGPNNRVVVIDDTNPDDPKEGKLIVAIVKDGENPDRIKESLKYADDADAEALSIVTKINTNPEFLGNENPELIFKVHETGPLLFPAFLRRVRGYLGRIRKSNEPKNEYLKLEYILEKEIDLLSIAATSENINDVLDLFEDILLIASEKKVYSINSVLKPIINYLIREPFQIENYYSIVELISGDRNLSKSSAISVLGRSFTSRFGHPIIKKSVVNAYETSNRDIRTLESLYQYIGFYYSVGDSGNRASIIDHILRLTGTEDNSLNFIISNRQTPDFSDVLNDFNGPARLDAVFRDVAHGYHSNKINLESDSGLSEEEIGNLLFINFIKHQASYLDGERSSVMNSYCMQEWLDIFSKYFKIDTKSLRFRKEFNYLYRLLVSEGDLDVAFTIQNFTEIDTQEILFELLVDKINSNDFKLLVYLGLGNNRHKIPDKLRDKINWDNVQNYLKNLILTGNVMDFIELSSFLNIKTGIEESDEFYVSIVGMLTRVHSPAIILEQIKNSISGSLDFKKYESLISKILSQDLLDRFRFHDTPNNVESTIKHFKYLASLFETDFRLDSEIFWDFVVRRFRESFSSQINNQLSSLFSIVKDNFPDFRMDNLTMDNIDNINSTYSYIVDKFLTDTISLHSFMSRIELISSITGVEFHTSRINEIIIRATKNNASELLDDLFPFVKLFRFESDVLHKIGSSILNDYFSRHSDSGHKKKTLFKIISSFKKLGLDPEVILLEFKNNFNLKQYLGSDQRLHSLVLNIHNLKTNDDPEVLKIFEVFKSNPGFNLISRILNIQSISNNADNSPWLNVIIPAMASAFLDYLNPLDSDDIEIFYSYIENFRSIHSKRFMSFYFDLLKDYKSGDIKLKTKKTLSELGVNINTKGGGIRSLGEVINEIKQLIKSLTGDLLLDRIPQIGRSQIGSDLFNQIKKGGTYNSSQSLRQIIPTWEETVKRNPSLNTLPPGFKPATFPVSPLNRKQENADDIKAIQQILDSREVRDVYSPIVESLVTPRNINLSSFLTRKIEDYENEKRSIKDFLEKSPVELAQMLEIETDEDKKAKLKKKIKSLSNPKAREAMARQVGVFTDLINILQGLLTTYYIDYSGDPGIDKFDIGIVSAMERLAELDGKLPLGGLIRDISSYHIYGLIHKSKTGGINIDYFNSITSLPVQPIDRDNIDDLSRFCHDYIEEHYLHHLQETDHSGHTPFSDRLYQSLTSVWQQQLDRDGRLPIAVLNNKIQAILGGDSDNKNRIPITMVPVCGILNIFSGDLGGSCHVNKQNGLASGDYPDLRTWVFVSNRGKRNEVIRGSVLAIRAKIDYPSSAEFFGSPILVVRANNPNENFIQSVDCDEFVIKTLKEAINTARRAWVEGGKKGFYSVGIPMDVRGMASTNRQKVNDVYRARFKGNIKVQLFQTNETKFNGYHIFNSAGETPVVTIWTIDESGNETWQGDWTVKS